MEFASLAPSTRERLFASGYRDVAALKDVKPVALARELGIGVDEAVKIKQTLAKFADGGGVKAHETSALDMLRKESESPGIVTFCQDMDRMLGGGVQLGEITEFCGVPGVGKTQVGLQLAVDVQLPPCFGGVGGSAVYIDTEGSFMAERVHAMAAAFVSHIQALAKRASAPTESVESARVMTVEGVLERIYVFRVVDLVEQMGVVRWLCGPDSPFMRDHPDVKLIVLDSMAFHFRHGQDDLGLRTRQLATMAQQLSKLATSMRLAVVVINQMTTKFASRAPGPLQGPSGAAGDDSKMTPALGEAWSHATNNRVILSLTPEGQRVARLIKSSSKPQGTATYAVVTAGIRRPGTGGPPVATAAAARTHSVVDEESSAVTGKRAAPPLAGERFEKRQMP